jgi:DNA integrity scanning protein DisA with diadenylate cyclase activity
MVHSAEDLQKLKGVGSILAKRLYDAGFDSFAKIGHAGEEQLKKVRGINPRAVISIIEQAKQLAAAQPLKGAEREEAVKRHLAEMKEKIQNLARVARERFQQELAGKRGRKLSANLVRIEDALARLADRAGRNSKRVGKALVKAEKKVAGLEDAGLKKLRKGLKRARKTVIKAL